MEAKPADLRLCDSLILWVSAASGPPAAGASSAGRWCGLAVARRGGKAREGASVGSGARAPLLW